jgi:hypothetical protein
LLNHSFAVVAPVDVLKAQDVLQTPVAADELSDEEIRQLLAEESIDRFTRWKRRGRRFYRKSIECSDYKGIQGPTKPVFCEPADVPAEQVELHRESQRQQGSTFLTEPMPKF